MYLQNSCLHLLVDNYLIVIHLFWNNYFESEKVIVVLCSEIYLPVVL
jgi:hypothetical protein